MYEELKAALIPASEQIALAKEALHLAQKIQLAAIFIIIFGFVFSFLAFILGIALEG